MENITEARIYVGTYGKYNGGSLFGEWFDLADYSSREEFFEAVAEYHKEEPDPEYMFQDWENIPSDLINESWVSEKVFLFIEAMQDMSDDEKEAFNIWLSWTGEDKEQDPETLVEKFRDEHVGSGYSSEVDYAEEFVSECYPEITGFAESYFDYEKFARDLFMDGYYFEDGHVFRN